YVRRRTEIVLRAEVRNIRDYTVPVIEGATLCRDRIDATRAGAGTRLTTRTRTHIDIASITRLDRHPSVTHHVVCERQTRRPERINGEIRNCSVGIGNRI